MNRIVIDSVTRIEGHAKITLHMGDDGKVADARLNVTQVRGFEKFTEGRPFYEMPGITARICGICPVSHLLASSKACDAIMAVRIPEPARKLRELLHCAQFVQSHALSFFYLSSPDLLLGMESDPAKRNVVGVIEKYPEMARDGIELRKFGQQVIEALAKERIHPSWVAPGGVNAPLTQQTRDRILSGLPRARAIADKTMSFFKGVVDQFQEEIEFFGPGPTACAGLVDRKGALQLYEGFLRFRASDGLILEDGIEASDYYRYIGEATTKDSYLKSPYYAVLGYPAGIYRVGPLARLNAADRCGTYKADLEFQEFHRRFGLVAESSFLYHYARLIEIIYGLERMEALLNDPAILDTHVRAKAGVNSLEGVGMIEAPRGVLIHHYKVNEEGAITWANLIVATGHNNMAINKGITEAAKHYVDGTKLREGMLNRVSAVVRAYDPCLSCSTHANGQIAMQIQLLSPEGVLLDELRSH
ncbi:MAG: Ni/Fe hydrogenase subunit alpha [Acidobacteria bacterium]|mgnify:CR=1 FL=1|nr:Ni/Fe hydrogenase subunit alpha [Acidobacteriota bacterium]